jgi:glutamate racemase
MEFKREDPIGIFDSGVGGLTVAAAIKQILPAEQIIYFGDTAHLPYGDKSSDSVRHYSRIIVDFLLEHNCKSIVIACNTASAAAYNDLNEYIGKEVNLLNVIDPVVNYVGKAHPNSRIGVIGTKGTINSSTYEKKISETAKGIDVKSMATPLLVPMIEEGFIFDDISNAIIRAYLSHKKLKDLDALILGCTHYPIIKNQVRKFYNFNVEVIDSAQAVSMALKETLIENDLTNSGTPEGNKFYVSDFTEYFEKIARMFFEDEIHLETKDIWR